MSSYRAITKPPTPCPAKEAEQAQPVTGWKPPFPQQPGLPSVNSPTLGLRVGAGPQEACPASSLTLLHTHSRAITGGQVFTPSWVPGTTLAWAEAGGGLAVWRCTASLGTPAFETAQRVQGHSCEVLRFPESRRGLLETRLREGCIL